MQNILKLFGVVPESKDIKCIHQATLLSDYGVYITEGAVYALSDIQKFLKENYSPSKDLNNSFYKSFHEVQSKSSREIFLDQIQHYLSTYGTNFNQEYLYIPNGGVKHEDTQESNVVIKVIHSQPIQTIRERLLVLLYANIAYSEDTLDSILSSIEELEIDITLINITDIQNKELCLRVRDRYNLLSDFNSTELFRYLVFKSIGSTLLIKDGKTINNIENSRFELPPLTEKQLILLSEVFNRFKRIFLAFKKSHSSNARVVNKISKLSKRFHKPMGRDILATITSGNFSREELEGRVNNCSLAQLIRTLNSIKYYSHPTNQSRLYRIRNGKSITKSKRSPATVDSVNNHYSHLLGHTIYNRLKPNIKPVVYIPKGVRYPIPTTEKSFVGSFPRGTSFFIPDNSNLSMLIGIHWVGEDSDIDISGVSEYGKVGWNVDFNTEGGNKITYSGDVTSAPNGATEWLLVEKLDKPVVITANAFSCPDNQKFNVLLGYHPKNALLQKNYVIEPNNLKFDIPQEFDQSSSRVVGIVSPCEGGIKFYLDSFDFGYGRVSEFTDDHKLAIESLLCQFDSQLSVADIFNITSSLEDSSVECVDLSIDKLSVDTIIKLCQ